MNATVNPHTNTIEQAWKYGSHYVHREQFFYLGDDGEVCMDVTVTIDHWEKFVFYHAPDQQKEAMKLLPYLDTWDLAHGAGMR